MPRERGVKDTKPRSRGVPSLPLEGKMLSVARQMRWNRALSEVEFARYGGHLIRRKRHLPLKGKA